MGLRVGYFKVCLQAMQIEVRTTFEHSPVTRFDYEWSSKHRAYCSSHQSAYVCLILFTYLSLYNRTTRKKKICLIACKNYYINV